MQHFPKNCFHFPESSVKFASSTKNEVRKFGEVRSSSSLKSLFATQVHRRGGVIARRSRGTQVDWPDWPERLDSCTSLLDPCTPRKRMESEAMFAEFQFSTIIEII